jgi:predicted alpha/beta-hydrolase family hydrolase
VAAQLLDQEIHQFPLKDPLCFSHDMKHHGKPDKEKMKHYRKCSYPVLFSTKNSPDIKI